MRVLLIEDEFLVATAVEAVLDSMGCEVVGPAATVEAALSLLSDGEAPDVAIVDLNLRGEPSEPVALELDRRHIPFVFATGYDVDDDLSARFPAAQWLRKPYTDQQIRASLMEIMNV
ncbi:MAG: response regulator [Magnetospirillum sp.]|nr:response regulator [Magnetospirillum sp.]